MTRTLNLSAALILTVGMTAGGLRAQEPNPTFSLGAVAVNDQPVQGAPVTTLTVSPGDVINVELYVRDWSPVGDDLRAYQIQLDEAGFTTGDGGSIKPVGYEQSLEQKSDNPAGAFIDLNHPFFVHAGLQTIALTDTKNARGYRWLSVLVDIDLAPVSPQDGTKFYCGSVNLAVSSDAAGTFAIGPVENPQVTGLLKESNRAISPIGYERLTVTVKTGAVRHRILATSPPDGAIDTRYLGDSGDGARAWQSIELTFDAAAASLAPSDFRVSDSSGAPPTIEGVRAEGAAVTLTLDRPIRTGAWTTLMYVPSGYAFRIGVLPGDVNGDAVSDSRDLLAMLEVLNGNEDASDRADITGDGTVDTRDPICLIDLLTARLTQRLGPT